MLTQRVSFAIQGLSDVRLGRFACVAVQLYCPLVDFLDFVWVRAATANADSGAAQSRAKRQQQRRQQQQQHLG